MKLSDIHPNIERSELLSEQFFSIQDTGMIFDILRNKMYSNPILAICREITCNARDAHREVGKFDEPIIINLPSALEPFFKVKDFGPGISQDRMSNIFIKYTASTKRDDNVQTGGFGLGAKTPFSYSDTFSIVTVNNGVKYNYTAYIDETKIGKLTQMSKVNTDEKNGTEIIIPVKPSDFNYFRDNTISATSHWDLKPLIKGLGANFNYPDNKKIVFGDDWEIIAKADWQKNVKAIIDGIEYPISIDSVRTYANGKFIDSLNGHLHLKFEVGELSLSANREQIYFDDSTKNKIKDKISKAYDEVKVIVKDKLSKFPSYWEANVFYRQELSTIFADFAIMGTLDWNGLPLFAGYLHTTCSVIFFKKGSWSKKFGADPNKIVRARRQEINFDKNALLLVNDLDILDVTLKHVKEVFAQNPTIASIQVVCPNAKCTETQLNSSIHLDKMNPARLSSFITASKKRAVSGTRLLLFKFISGEFKLSSHAAFDDDTKTKIICRIKKYDNDDTRRVIYGAHELYPATISKIAGKFPDYSFYGVNENITQNRIDEEFSELSFDKFVDDNILSLKREDYIKIKFMEAQRKSIDYRWSPWIKHIVKNITDPTSLFLKMINVAAESIKDENLQDFLIYELVNKPLTDNELKAFAKDHEDINIEVMNNECAIKYPMFKLISTYIDEVRISTITDYINLIDKQ